MSKCKDCVWFNTGRIENRCFSCTEQGTVLRNDLFEPKEKQKECEGCKFYCNAPGIAIWCSKFPDDELDCRNCRHYQKKDKPKPNGSATLTTRLPEKLELDGYIKVPVDTYLMILRNKINAIITHLEEK